MRLVDSRLLLQELDLRLWSDISHAALKILGRACRQLKRLKLTGYFDLYWACLTAEAEVDRLSAPALLFPHLQSLGLTGFAEHDGHSYLAEPMELGETVDYLETATEQSLAIHSKVHIRWANRDVCYIANA